MTADGDSARAAKAGMDPALAAPAFDGDNRPGVIARLIVFVVVMIACAILLTLFKDRLGQPFLLGLVGVFTMIGAGYLFATAIGFVEIGPRSPGDRLAKAYLDSMSEGVVVTDDRQRIVYANRAYGEMTGATAPSAIRTVDALLAGEPEAADQAWRLSAEVREGRAAATEFRLPRALSGEHEGRWYRLRVRPFRSTRRGETLQAWRLADISGERAEQERFFKDLQTAIDHLDRAPAGFLAAGPDGSVTYLNATLAGWLGIDLANFRGGEIGLDDIVAGDGRALIAAVRAEPGQARTATLDLDLLTQAGRALPVRVIHTVSALSGGEPGPMRSIVLNRATGEDSTSALRAAEVRFTRFFNSTPMAIAGVDREGRLVRTNAPFLSLFSAEVDGAAVERHLRLENVLGEGGRAELAQALARAFEGLADIQPFDTAAAGDDRRTLRVYVSAVAEGAGEGGEEAAIVYVVDVTEQKELEVRMAQSSKMQAVGQLAGGIAHDFNNVLQAILMASDLLLANHRASDPSFADIMNIKQNANRAASLVRQLLAFSRRQTLRPEVLSLTDVLADLRMLLTRLAGTSIRLEIEHGRDLWPVKADLGEFERVIVNLVTNARDAMPEGGQLAIRTRNVAAHEIAAFGHRELTEQDHVLIEVADSGHGIPPDVLKQIFEPFFTTKEVGKGTGLGLSMVYGIVKQTGGFIYAVSEPGEGATFRIFLPRHVPVASEIAEAKANGQAKPEKARDLSGSATILLVEDEDAVRMSGVRALVSRGYTVHEATSGAEALEKFAELGGAVDLVVSDVVMPEMDGPTLLKELRAQGSQVKFIFVSGYAEDAFARNLPPESKFGFLPKPFSLKQLATTVKETLEA